MAMGVYGFNMNIDTFIVGFFFLLCIEECSVKKKKAPKSQCIRAVTLLIPGPFIHSYIHSLNSFILLVIQQAVLPLSLPPSAAPIYSVKLEQQAAQH